MNPTTTIHNHMQVAIRYAVILAALLTTFVLETKAQATHATGVENGVVYLNDLEDHNWTYYSGVDSSVDGGNYNDNYKGLIYSPNPRNVMITYKGNGGAVSMDNGEGQETFVYYKTLEQDTSTGQYPYTVISNPFSKRPAGKGFGGWKIASGGDYIDGYSNGDTLPFDQAITFINLPYPSTNCISAEIVFEAVWVPAHATYLTSVTTDNNNYDFDTTNPAEGVVTTHENNFLIIDKTYSGTITVKAPCTIMMVEPDGSTDYRDKKFTGAIVPMVNGNTKIEFAQWNPQAAVDAQGQNFTIGRGMKMGTSKALYGTGAEVVVDQILKVESGKFTTFDHYKVAPTSITRQWVTFGCDYDRARKDDTRLTFTNAFIVGSSLKFNPTVEKTTELCRTYSLSGNFMTKTSLGNAGSGNSYYVSVTGASQKGCRYLEIQGGTWHANIAGGMDANDKTTPTFRFRMRGGEIKGSVYGSAQHATGNGTRSYVITGGTIRGWVAGGANGTAFGNGTMDGVSYVYVGGNARVDSNGSTTIINRAIGGNVFGAGCGYCDLSNSGQVSQGTNVVIADNAYVERGVYGGGSFGYCPTDMTSNIYITGGCVDGKPGGVNAKATGSSDTNGNPVYDAEPNNTITGGVFGGACQNKGGHVNIYMTGGTVNGGIYGGSNATGTICGNVTMKILGGHVGSMSENGETSLANIHGGGYGESTVIGGNVMLTIGSPDQTDDGVVVYGDVYGGSALGTVNYSPILDSKKNITGYKYVEGTRTDVVLYNGSINGSLYGGALGYIDNENSENNIAANVYGPVTVKVYGGSVKATTADGSGGIYGANNLHGTPLRSVTVDIYGTAPATDEDEYAVHAVYGGGNKASYIHDDYPTVTVHNNDNSIEYVYGGGNAAAVKATDVTIWGGNVIGNVFGGGNGTARAADVSGSTNVKVYGGTIGNVYGGSNTSGTINGTINVTANSRGEGENTPNTMLIGSVYGGGNRAASKAGNILIGCTGDEGHIGNVYGGANQADITTDIDLRLNSGSIGNVFGGNNVSGNISGTVTVTVEDESADCGVFTIDNVYGGGNLAAYTHNGNYPVVNMKSGIIRHAIYGGGLGETAIVTGNPQVVMTGGTVGHSETIDGNEVVYGDIFGGGNEADVKGNTSVTITGGEVKRNVYGGGNQAAVSGTTNVIIGQ